MQLTEPIETLDPKTFPLHRYKPVEKLGHGESGRAFLCFDQFMEHDVVVKAMGSIEVDKVIEFQRDATLLCRLNNRGLAQVLDFGCTASGTAYIVSEYHPGVSLSQHISAGEPLPLDLALKTFIVIADALAQMHVHGILHRDLKTSNILVRNLDASDCAIYLLDAGTGRVKIATMQPNIYEGREVPGNPNYMCPEYASRLHYDSRSEIFALGCTIFEALTGRTPFIGAESLGNLTRRNAPSLSQVSQGILFPHRIEDFVAKCLSRPPESRYQSMPEVLQALKELAKLRLSVERVDIEIAPNAANSRSRAHRQVKLKAAPGADTSTPNSDNFYQEEHPVRLVNTDWMDSSSDLSTDVAEKETSTNAESRLKRSRAAKRQPFDAATLAPPDESLAYFASSNIAFAKTESKRKRRASSVSSSAGASSNPASPVVAAEPEVKPGFANAIKRTYDKMIDYHVNSEYSIVSMGILAGLILCLTVPTISYISYLCAPSVEVKGVVVGYEQAAGLDNGMLELASVDNSGTSLSTTTMYIESPAQNLPTYDDASDTTPVNTFESDLSSNQRIWDEETLNLDQLNFYSEPVRNETTRESGRTSAPMRSDIVLGQRWDVFCRKQWDGKLIVEKLKSGVIPLDQENFEKIHFVISRMVQSIATSQPDSDADLSWASDDFNWEIELFPYPSRFPPNLSLFPSSQLRLKSYNPTECVMMIKPPPWMTNLKYLSVTLGRAGNDWRVEGIEECTEAEWNHRQTK